MGLLNQCTKQTKYTQHYINGFLYAIDVCIKLNHVRVCVCVRVCLFVLLFNVKFRTGRQQINKVKQYKQLLPVSIMRVYFNVYVRCIV